MYMYMYMYNMYVLRFEFISCSTRLEGTCKYKQQMTQTVHYGTVHRLALLNVWTHHTKGKNIIKVEKNVSTFFVE